MSIAELRCLTDMQADGLVEIDGDQGRVTPAGWLLVRNVTHQNLISMRRALLFLP